MISLLMYLSSGLFHAETVGKTHSQNGRNQDNQG